MWGEGVFPEKAWARQKGHGLWGPGGKVLASQSLRTPKHPGSGMGGEGYRPHLWDSPRAASGSSGRVTVSPSRLGGPGESPAVTRPAGAPAPFMPSSSPFAPLSFPQTPSISPNVLEVLPAEATRVWPFRRLPFSCCALVPENKKIN